MTPPDDGGSDEEGDALALWDGHGAVRLLRRDRRRRALLLERARPGSDLAGIDEAYLRNPSAVSMRLDVTERRLAAFAAAWLDGARTRASAVIRCAYPGADENEVQVLRALI